MDISDTTYTAHVIHREVKTYNIEASHIKYYADTAYCVVRLNG